MAIDIASTIAQAHNVVYVAGEAVEEMEPRLDAWRAHHKRSLERLWLWCQPVMLFERGSVGRFVRDISHVHPVLVVLDPLAEMFAGGNENESADMTVAIKSINLIRSTLGCGMLLVHHSGWTDRHERGSSVLRAAVRLSFSVSRTDERIKLVAEKCSAGRAIDDRNFQILELRTESVDGADPSREGEYTVAIPARKLALEIGPLPKRQKQMIEALALEVFSTGAKFSDLVDHLGVAKSTANNNLSALIKRTLVTRKDNIYRLTSAGHDVVRGFETDSEVLAEAGPNSDLYWPLCVTK